MADFTLEAGIKVASGGVDDFIREVQGELNKKKISIPFTPDKYSVQAFAQRLTSELKKSEIEVRARANSQDVNAFINKLQEGLNKSSKLYLPFEPKSESVAAFAKKLQDEINKSDIKVEVKVDAKKAKEAASGADEAAKAVNELNSAIDRYYKLVSRRETISFVGLNKKEVEDIDINLRRVTETLDRYGVSVSDLEDAYRNGNLVEYLNSLNLGTDEYGKTLKIVEDSIQRYSKSEGAAAEIIRKRAQAAMDEAQAEGERAAKEEVRAAKAEEAEIRRAKALANAKAMEQADADAKRDNAKAEEELFAAGEKRLTTLNKTTKIVGQIIKAFIGFHSIVQLVRSLYQNVLDLDKAIVDLQIATGETRSVVSGMVKDYAKLGQQLGVTTVDITKAADSWLRQGYNAADSTKLITASTMLAKLGQIEMSAATDYLTSSMKGYGISAENVVDIVDKLSAVDLVSATSAGDLAAAMQKTAVTANQVGIPLNKLIGMIATISEVSQQSATTVGTAMKSMLARMVNIKAGFLSDPESGETLSNVEAALRGIGVVLRDSNGDFREMSFILDEVAGKWDTLTGLQQSAVAVALGGTRQQENVRILMEYWDQVNNLTSVAATSTGAAQEKFEAYSGGIESRMNALKAAWQGLSASVVNSALIKKAISFLTTIVNLFTEIGTVGRFAISGVAIGAGKEFVTAFKNMIKYGFSWADSLNIAITQVKFWFKELWTSIRTYWGNIVQLISANPYLIAIGALVALTAAAIKYSKTVQERFEESKEEFDGLSESIDANKKKLEELNKQIEENEALKGTSSWTDELDKETSALHAQYIELQQVNAELEAQKKLKLNETLGNWADTYSGGISTEKKPDIFSFTNGVYARRVQDVSRDFVTDLVSKQLGLSYADAFKVILAAEGNQSVKLPKGYRNPFKAKDALKSIGLEFGWDNQDDRNSAWQYTAQTDDEYIDALTSRLDVYDEGSQQYWEARSKLIEMAGEYYKGIRAYEDLWGEEIKDADRLDSENFKVYQEMIKRRNMIELNLGNTSMFYYGTYAQNKNKASGGKDATVSSSLRLVSLDLTQAESDAVKLKNAYVTVIKALNEDASLNRDLSVTGEEFADSANLLISNYASLADSFGVWQSSGMSNLDLIGVIVETYESAEEAQKAAAKSGGLKTLTSDLDSLSKTFDSEADFLEAIQKVRGDLDSLDGMPSEFKEHINGILDSFVESKDIKAFYGEIIDEFALDDDAVIYIRDSWFTAAERIEEGPKELFEKFEGYVSTLESALSEDPESVAKAKLGLRKFVEQVFGADSETFARIDGWIQKVGNADYTIEQFKNDIAGMAGGSAFESYVDFSWLKAEDLEEKVDNFTKATDDFEKAANRLQRNKAIADMRSAAGDILGKDSGAYRYIDALITMLDFGWVKIEDFRDEIYRLAESDESLAPILELLNFDWKKVTVPPTTKDAFNALKDVFDADWQVDKDSAINALMLLLANMEGVSSDDANALKAMLETANLSADKGSIIDMIVEFLQGSDIAGASELIEKLLQLKDATGQKSKSDLFSDLSGAISGFTSNGSAFEKNQSAGSIASAARLFFGDQFFDDNNIQEWIDRLRLGEITLDDFKNKIWEISQGTFMSQFIPDSWKKELPDVNKQLQDLASSLNSLMSQGSDAQRNDVFEKIKEDMSGIADLTPEMRSALEDAMQAFLDSGDDDAFKAAIVEVFSGDEEMRRYILDSWLPEAKNVKDIVSDINSMFKEDTQQGRDEYYKKISDALALLGITAENTAGTGLFEFLQALQAGTLDGEEFERQLYAIAEALTKLLQAAGIDIDLTRFLPDQEQPESMESRIATATGSGYGAKPYGESFYGSNFASAYQTLGTLTPGQLPTSDQINALLSAIPQLRDEIVAFGEAAANANGDTTVWTEALARLDAAIREQEGLQRLNDLEDALKDYDSADRVIEQTDALQEMWDILEDMDVDMSQFDDMNEMLEYVRDNTWLVDEAFRNLQEDTFLDIAGSFGMNADDANAALQQLMTQGLEVSEMSDEMLAALLATGHFHLEKKEETGKLDVPVYNSEGIAVDKKTLDMVTQQYILVPDTDNPYEKITQPKKHGGGGKKGNKGGGKTSILSEQYTNDKGLYETMIDNIKNLNNLYEEGSEEWLRNQQRIIETYQAYAKTIQDEYDRLVKAGISMSDKEMQTLAKDLLKVNKEMYDAAKEYWEAVRDNMKESMEHIVDQMDAVLDLRKAHKDLLTELRQENRELEKQYKIAQDEAAHPGLTEAERELLFSSEDYKRLTGMLQDISKQADALYEDYKNKIASVTEDETYAISYITDEYERQLGLLESQYEIAKQQLAVEKARQELQNTLRERNTAVLINGAWTWMADPDAVQAAMEKVADAEVELEDAITDSEFNKETAEIETARDAIKSSIDAMEALEFAIEDLADGIVDLADAINENIFNAIGTTSRNYLNQTKGHGLDMFRSELTELQNTSGLVFSNTDVERLYSLLSSGNTLNSSNIFDDSIVHDSAAIASILSNTTNNSAGSSQTVIINGITLSDSDSEMLLNALDRVAYTWQA